jgi:threonine aldolase
LARAADRLGSGLKAIPGVRLAWPRQVNEVFAIAPRSVLGPVLEAGARLYEWTSRAVAPSLAPREDETFFRLVCSFETTDAEVDQFLAIVRNHCDKLPARAARALADSPQLR